MKAVLVIDMPSSCTMCKADKICKVWNEEQVKFKGYNDRLDGCPLKPMPKRKNIYTDIDADGWNACLEELTGETE